LVALCPGAIALDTNVQLADGRPFVVALDREVPASELDRQPLLGVAVFTDGDATTIERVRTKLETSFPGAPAALTGSDLEAQANFRVHDIARLSNVALALTLVIAGCSLAVAVAGGLVERKRPFALLRLTGMPLRDLHRVVLAEAAAPLLVVAAVSVGLGFLVDTILLAVIGQNGTFRVPSIGYWGALAGGLAVALVVVAATLPLLDRLTSLETARFE
jgi:predicted lysophospholipase L1 biosynthesis ABC-type transport system permease subunit